MSKLWRTSNIDHKIRTDLGLSLAEYCYLDLVYKSQNHKDFSDGDWAKISYAHAARNLGMGKSSIHKMTDRLVENTNYIEVNSANPELKKVTPEFYDYAYTWGGGKSERQDGKGVEKVNGAVEKVNDKGGKSERHTKYKDNSNLKDKVKKPDGLQFYKKLCKMIVDHEGKWKAYKSTHGLMVSDKQMIKDGVLQYAVWCVENDANLDKSPDFHFVKIIKWIKKDRYA